MIYCTEIRTIRHDGSEIMHRMIMPSCSAAKLTAFAMLEEMSPESLNLFTRMDFPYAPWFTNDFGEKVNIRANVYGDQSQIREGTFYLYQF